MSRARDLKIARAVAAWFGHAARSLPWRGSGRSGYSALVSELMLQQTQVARVVPKFTEFMARFPTPTALAAADEADVLAAWSGLGYYRRARLLHAAAHTVVERHGGEVPSRAAELLELPGVGRYTAGAIASTVFGEPAPIVDGNVSRVLLRIEGREQASSDPLAQKWAWDESERLVQAAAGDGLGAGVFNEGLMELGATVCTPSSPRCEQCPLASHCTARRLGRQNEIPHPKPAARRTPLRCASVLLHDHAGRVLVERRPRQGLWAGMWQAPTLETSRMASRAAVESWIGLSPLTRVAKFAHGVTHRDVVFTVFCASPLGRGDAGRLAVDGRTWITPARASVLAMSNAQRRIILGSLST